MKFPLSESNSLSIDADIRLVNDGEFPMLLMNLLTANSNEGYKIAAMRIREYLRPNEDSDDYYNCINPGWFDDLQNEKIDYTTCIYCGYRKNCTINIEQQNYIEIVPFGNARIPSRNFINRQVLFPIISTIRSNTDPFFGFSMRAGSTRKLYLLTQTLFDSIFPNKSSINFQFDAAIGYDMPTGKAIWPIDQQFLEIYEQITGIINFEIIGKQGIMDGNLTSIDRKCLLDVAIMNGWIKDSDDGEVISELELLCSRLILVLKSKSMIYYFNKLANIQMTPILDLPYVSSGSGHLNLVLRWLELKPLDIQIYLDSLNDDLDESNHCKIVSKIFPLTVTEVPQGLVSLYPRFPAIALSPPHELDQIEIEQPACRIIDVVEHKGIERMLLLDCLGIDLGQVI
jgi:hypothetical protein